MNILDGNNETTATASEYSAKRTLRDWLWRSVRQRMRKRRFLACMGVRRSKSPKSLPTRSFQVRKLPRMSAKNITCWFNSCAFHLWNISGSFCTRCHTSSRLTMHCGCTKAKVCSNSTLPIDKWRFSEMWRFRSKEEFFPDFSSLRSTF